MNNNYDAIVIGAGSSGAPISMELADKKLRVLVIEANPSPGQGQNKAAIGGIRATFSDAGKIQVCLQSLDIIANWKENYGDDVGWFKGGYLFPVYTEELENSLKKLLEKQHKYGLNIDWISPEQVKELVPGIDPVDLRGGTYSPDDGNISPLKTVTAIYRRAKRLGAEFHFSERVTGVKTDKGKIAGVKTDKGDYNAPVLVVAAGANAREIGEMMNVDIQVFPDMHEAGITEPVKKFFDPMVVDLRKRPGSSNFYFYQNDANKIVFCLTPDPPLWGKDRRSTSDFLPMVSKRLIELVPRLHNIRVRRTWRGLYPMTPDGIPIVGKINELDGLYLAVGMCGQGLMLGPGISKNVASLITTGKPAVPEEVFSEFRYYRSYQGAVEMLK